MVLSPRAQAAKKAEEVVILQYLPLVEQIASRVMISLPSYVERQDLISSGSVGLLDAVRKWKPGLHSSLRSYAAVRIRGEMFDEMRRVEWIPRTVHTRAKHIKRAVEAFEQKYGRAPNDKEIAKALNISVAAVKHGAMPTFLRLDHSYDGTRDQIEEIEDATQEPAHEVVSRSETVARWKFLIAQLPTLPGTVLDLYYFGGLRLNEIGTLLGYTESHCCANHKVGIRLIKEQLGETLSNPDLFRGHNQIRVRRSLTLPPEKVTASGP